MDDAITAVVMSPRGIVNEHHFLGAFWLAVDHRCCRSREGRHFARLGSRVRVELDAARAQATAGVNPSAKTGGTSTGLPQNVGDRLATS